MDTHGLVYDQIWYECGKPNADIFIDDKGYRVPENPKPEDYKTVIEFVKETFGVG
jgi:hypothetical protein